MACCSLRRSTFSERQSSSSGLIAGIGHLCADIAVSEREIAAFESEITCSRVHPLGFFECVNCESNDPLCLIYWPCGLIMSYILAMRAVALGAGEGSLTPVNTLATALSPAWGGLTPT